MAFCHWVWRLDPCKHCGSPNVELKYLGSKNRLDGGPDTPPITRCRDCGKWSNEPIKSSTERPQDKIAEFMEAMINLGKTLKENNNFQKINACPNCGFDSCALQTYRKKNFQVHCYCCKMYGPRCSSRDEAIRLWNSIKIDK